VTLGGLWHISFLQTHDNDDKDNDDDDFLSDAVKMICFVFFATASFKRIFKCFYFVCLSINMGFYYLLRHSRFTCILIFSLSLLFALQSSAIVVVCLSVVDCDTSVL